MTLHQLIKIIRLQHIDKVAPAVTLMAVTQGISVSNIGRPFSILTEVFLVYLRPPWKVLV